MPSDIVILAVTGPSNLLKYLQTCINHNRQSDCESSQIVSSEPPQTSRHQSVHQTALPTSPRGKHGPKQTAAHALVVYTVLCGVSAEASSHWHLVYINRVSH